MLRADSCSCFLQDRRAGRAGQLRAEDMRGRDGESYAQADEDGEEACADELNGQSYDGRIGECSEGCAGAAFPPGGCDAEEGGL